MPPVGLAAGGGVVWVVMVGVAVAAFAAAGRLPAVAGVAASAFARVGMRLFTFSTTTALVRPWLKLWRTTPCSTPRPFRLKVLLGVTLSFFSPAFSVVSAIPVPILGRFAVLRLALVSQFGARRFADLIVAAAGNIRRQAGPETVKARGARQKRLAFGTGKQGCMYHI